MKNRIVIIATAALFGGALAHAGDTTTEFSHIVNGDGIMIASPSTHGLGNVQSIQGAAGEDAVIPAVTGDPFTVQILDRQGVDTTLKVDAEVNPLTNGTGNVRDTTVVARNAGGTNSAGVNFKDATTVNTAATAIADFVTTESLINRSFSFQVSITAEELNGQFAEAGTYEGSIVLTVE